MHVQQQAVYAHQLYFGGSTIQNCIQIKYITNRSNRLVCVQFMLGEEKTKTNNNFSRLQWKPIVTQVRMCSFVQIISNLLFICFSTFYHAVSCLSLNYHLTDAQTICIYAINLNQIEINIHVSNRNFKKRNISLHHYHVDRPTAVASLFQCNKLNEKKNGIHGND